MGNFVHQCRDTRNEYIAGELFSYFLALVLSILVLIIASCGACCCSKKCLSLYSLLFHQTIQVVNTEVYKTNTINVTLFSIGGYKYIKSKCMLHAYYLLMIFVAFNWFAIMFIDNFFYRKVTTCNDWSVQNSDYQCFDVHDSVRSKPVDCATHGNDDVICYLKSSNFSVALSLAFSLSQLIIFLIQVSFKFTLCCVKRCHYGCAACLNGLFLVSYIVFFAVYYWACIDQVDTVKHSALYNIFYGPRVMRIVMVAWGLITLIVISFFSPYCWLIDKGHKPIVPSYTVLESTSEQSLNTPPYSRTDETPLIEEISDDK